MPTRAGGDQEEDAPEPLVGIADQRGDLAEAVNTYAASPWC